MPCVGALNVAIIQVSSKKTLKGINNGTLGRIQKISSGGAAMKETQKDVRLGTIYLPGTLGYLDLLQTIFASEGRLNDVTVTALC